MRFRDIFRRRMRIVKTAGAKDINLAHDTDAGYDLRTPVDFTIFYGEAKTIDTRIAVEIPRGYCGLVLQKSGLAQRNIMVTTGVIDCGYTGDIKVRLKNEGDLIQKFQAGDKIAQLVLVKIDTPVLKQVKSLKQTERGAGGFGSTGR